MTREAMMEAMRRKYERQKQLNGATTQSTIEAMSKKEEEKTMTRTEAIEAINIRQNEANLFTNISEADVETEMRGEETMESKITYTEKNGRYYKTEDGKTTRISKAEYEKAKEAERWQAEADAEKKAREEKEAADAKATEDAINKKAEKAEKKEAKKDQPKAEKKERKPRKSKDIAFEDEEQAVTLTAKQVDFVLHLSDSDFWKQGLDSVLWCDVLCDEIGGQFAGKPMTIGAMISTLCEKGLAIRTKEKREKRTGTTFVLTIKGKLIASKVGLK